MRQIGKIDKGYVQSIMQVWKVMDHICQIGVRDASLTQVYSFLPASWAGNTHEETDILPIGDREEMGQVTTRLSY